MFGRKMFDNKVLHVLKVVFIYIIDHKTNKKHKKEKFNELQIYIQII